MYSKIVIPPYIGITDFENATQVVEMASVIPANSTRKLMVGVMSSYKWFYGETTKWERVWLHHDRLKFVFICHPNVFNTLHWADYENRTEVRDIRRILRKCGTNLQAVQLDMVWPKPELLSEIVSGFGLPVILQINERVMETCEYSPQKTFVKLLSVYGLNLSGVLFDKSMGRGKQMSPVFLRQFVCYFKAHRPRLHIAVAGGLGPGKLHLVKGLVKEFRDISIDAQGQLRDSGNSEDPINWDRARTYLEEAVQMFS